MPKDKFNRSVMDELRREVSADRAAEEEYAAKVRDDIMEFTDEASVILPPAALGGETNARANDLMDKACSSVKGTATILDIYSGPQNQDKISTTFKVEFAPFI